MLKRLGKIKKQKNCPKRRKKKFWLLLVAGFLSGFQLGLVLYVLSNFFHERSGAGNVSIFYVFSYAISLVALLNLHKLIIKYGKSKIFIAFLLFKALVLFFASLFFRDFFSIFLGIAFLAIDVLAWACLDLVVENYSKDKNTGKIRGAFLTSMNTGILSAPFLSAWTVEKFGYGNLFFVVAVLNIVIALIIGVGFGKLNHNAKKSPRIRHILLRMWENGNIAIIYYVSFLLEVFYAITVIYTPLFMLDLGISWVEIGKIFTVMLVPFVVVQYPLGIVADRRTGEKEWLFFALLVGAFFTAAISFLENGNIFIWMFVLLMTRIGAAIIEVMRDSYFYKNVGPSDVDTMNYFRTTKSAAYVLAMAVSGLFLLFFETRYVFLLLAVVLLSGVFPLLKLKDTK